uniref:RNA binding motif protein 19 n=1 Tax=Callorhinchus milii TaxID=7868 RepID=A0A4W3HSY9_CALMI
MIVYLLIFQMKEERFKGLFAAFGTLTDCILKFTKDGKFRKFGFVGFKSEEEAQAAFKHFNKSYIDTTRIIVEFCKSFGDPELAKPWSKHSQKNTTGQLTETSKQQRSEIETTKLKEDEGFQEFLAVNQSRCNVPTWANDTLPAKTKKEKTKKVDDYLNFDSDDSEELSEEEEESEKESEDIKNVALKKELSDMDYLKSKVIAAENEMSEDSDKSETSDSAENKKIASGKNVPLTPERDSESEENRKQENSKQEKSTPTRGQNKSLEKRVMEFFVPVKPVAIRIVKNANGNTTGYVFVDFQSEEDLKEALKRNKDYMGGRYIELFRENGAQKPKLGRKDKDRPWLKREMKADEEEEDIADSGRLFVRNLPYTCTEEDLEKIFSKTGPIAEIHFPIDSLTKRPKGFAFVTYMIPEHAVKALAEIDGEVFQGRMLHILPSTVKREKIENDKDTPGSSSYKRNKEAKDKANSNSSHNWNTLFMGTNAVADVIAAKYNATKSEVLDHEGKGSLAVRMALGETQIVQETRLFLIDNGVSLDSFSQAAGQRSKSVILVKNIPAGTKVQELEKLFAQYGDLGRVLLPGAGVTAIVEFLEPTEAKRAFTKLAYSKFQHVPLYLEWAPMNVFSTSPPIQKKKEESKTNNEGEEQSDQTSNKNETKDISSDEEEETIPGCTIFIKNLNFSTTEEALSKVNVLASSLLSMGYGFVEYKKPDCAEKALKRLQVTKPMVTSARKLQKAKKQKVSKILVRNIPFQAKPKEVRELFSTFGEIKTLRLPKKMGGTGTHRGFGFVDFLTRQDAKKAFDALCHSTHLYGRRLVLEWADTEETVEALRRKTAEHYHGKLTSYLNRSYLTSKSDSNNRHVLFEES